MSSPYRGRGRSPGRGGGRGHHGRPPAGLSGRDIGMYYARMSKMNEGKRRPVLHLEPQQQRKIEAILRHSAVVKKEEDPISGSPFMERYRCHLAANRHHLQDSAGVKKEDPFAADDEDIKRDPALDLRMKEEFRSEEPRHRLPAHEMRRPLLNLIASNQVVVVSGDTGCGKTTQVPQFLLDETLAAGTGSATKIVCTQPRRISAISVAERVAYERGERLGRSVGYQIRLENRSPRPRGSILFCTTGVVLQWLRSEDESFLSGVSHLILDEVHERDVQTDLLMVLIKRNLRRRPNLKVILMSATLNAQQFSHYFGGCPSVHIPGTTFPVEELYLEDALEWTGHTFEDRDRDRKMMAKPWHKHTKRGRDEQRDREDFQGFIQPYVRDLESCGRYSVATTRSLCSFKSEELDLDLVAKLLHKIHRANRNDGAILVFLTGWKEISDLHSRLTQEGSQFRFPPSQVQIHPLHSLMPTVNQRAIFDRPPEGMRKIVLATNIAETSITIEDVVYVIDCGKIKLTRFDASANVATLKPEWVSLANAKQRSGRAGRVRAGTCYHLYSRAREMTLGRFAVPEVLRTRLDEVVLTIKVLRLGDVTSFLQQLLDPPDEDSIQAALSTLTSINALTEETEELTPLGFHLAQLPTDPQTGKMILFGAMFSCLDPVLSVAASLSFKDAFVVPLGKEAMVDRKKVELSRGTKSDHLTFANAISGWENSDRRRDFCWHNFLSESTLKMLCAMKVQLAENLFNSRFVASKDVTASSSNRNSGNESLVRAVICAGLYPNVAKVKRNGRKGGPPFPRLSTAREKRVEIHPKSVNAKETEFAYPWMVYHLKMKGTGGTFLYDCSMVSPLALAFFGRRLVSGRETFPDGSSVATIAVDEFVKFNCSESTASLVKQIRNSLDRLLEDKITSPEKNSWWVKEEGGGGGSTLITATVELLSSEVQGVEVEMDSDG